MINGGKRQSEESYHLYTTALGTLKQTQKLSPPSALELTSIQLMGASNVLLEWPVSTAQREADMSSQQYDYSDLCQETFMS